MPQLRSIATLSTPDGGPVILWFDYDLGFDYDLCVVVSMPFGVCLQNFIVIGLSAAES